MRCFLTIFICLISNHGHSVVPDFSVIGSKSYTNSYTVLAEKTYKKVFTLTPEGKQKVEDFRKMGFDCVNQHSSLVICSKILKSSEISDIDKNLIHTQARDLIFHFSQPESTWSLFNEGDDIQEWIQSQKVQVLYKNQLIGESFRSRLVTSAFITKLVVSTQVQKFWFNYEKSELLYVPNAIKIENEEGWNLFLVAYKFN